MIAQSCLFCLCTVCAALCPAGASETQSWQIMESDLAAWNHACFTNLFLLATKKAGHETTYSRFNVAYTCICNGNEDKHRPWSWSLLDGSIEELWSLDLFLQYTITHAPFPFTYIVAGSKSPSQIDVQGVWQWLLCLAHNLRSWAKRKPCSSHCQAQKVGIIR